VSLEQHPVRLDRLNAVRRFVGSAVDDLADWPDLHCVWVIGHEQRLENGRISTRALLQLLAIFSSFAQLGIKPHCATNASRTLASWCKRMHASGDDGGILNRRLNWFSWVVGWSNQPVDQPIRYGAGWLSGHSAFRSRCSKWAAM
jgi:hypothetical protein